MRYWRQVRQLRAIVAVSAVTVLALLFPVTVLTATPSPGGATVGLAALLALGLPVLMGWGVSRGDPDLEQRSLRPVALLDLGLILLVGAGASVVEFTLWVGGAAPAGLIAARATLTYIGLMLAAVPRTGYGNASLLPVVYFMAVVIVGGGGDVAHPALWAWIAAPDEDPVALVLALTSLTVGVLVYLLEERGH